VIPGKSYTPQDLAQAAWRRRWWMAVSFTIFAAIALGVVLSLPRSYYSVATIEVVPEQVSDAYVRGGSQPRLAERLSSIGQTTLTRTRLEGVIKDLDLYADLRQRSPMEQAAERMRSDITFKSTDRDVFVLGFTAQDPQIALAVATRLTAIFLEENARDRGQQADAATSFLGSQLETVGKKLDEQERQIELYKAQHAGELPSELAMNVQELNNSQLILRSVVESVNRDQDQRLLLQRQLEAVDSAAISGGLAGTDAAGSLGAAAVGPLEAARANLTALELRLTPEHPDVERAKRTIARLEAQQAAAVSPSNGDKAPTSTDPRRDVRAREIQGQIDILDRRLASNQTEMRRLRTRIDEYSRRIAVAPVRESEYALLTRDYEETKKLHSSLTQEQQKATMASSLARNDVGDRFRVVEPARLPEKPFGQSRRNALLFALALAVGISVSLGAFVEYRDDSLRSEADVSASLRLPVLAAIPELSQATRRGVR